MIRELIAAYMRRYHKPEATLEEIKAVLGPSLNEPVKIPVRAM